jgi:hypothetical protein
MSKPSLSSQFVAEIVAIRFSLSADLAMKILEQVLFSYKSQQSFGNILGK